MGARGEGRGAHRGAGLGRWPGAQQSSRGTQTCVFNRVFQRSVCTSLCPPRGLQAVATGPISSCPGDTGW